MNRLIDRFKKGFWEGDGGGRQALRIAFPLILSTSSFTVMHVTDRKFLILYSSDAFAACAPAGMLSFMFISLFMGTAGYVNAFVAQYTGAGRPERVGASLWQGIYFSLIAWLALAPLSLIASPVFARVGHGGAIEALEAIYFRILILGGGAPVLNMALSSFYSGRGKTYVVMWVNFFAMFLNIPLGYCMIFGKLGFPRMGIAGAGLAAVISSAAASVLFLAMAFSPRNHREFRTRSQWRFNRELFGRLLRFGLPSGIQFMIDMIGFTFFLFMVGRLGDVELKATNAAWTLNTMIFMPMIGFARTVSIIVGQEIGRGRIEIAKRATRNSFAMVFTYMSAVAVAFVAAPRPLLGLLMWGVREAQAEQITNVSIVLLRFVAFYSLFDAAGLVYSSAIAGAGDTRFVMWVTLGLSTMALATPSYLACAVWRLPVTVAWSFATIYVVALALTFFWRYETGHWQRMRVIEWPAEGEHARAPVFEA